jgi:hypothetical protein
MSPRTLAGAAALLTALAAPATAQALPTMAPLEPCYVTADTAQGPQSEGVQIAASGFTPNSTVQLTIDGAPVPGGEQLQIDANGALLPLPAVPAPFVEEGSKPFTVALTETGNPANTVSATAKSTALGVSVKPQSAKPSDRVRFKGLGFTKDKPIYAHYIHTGELRKTVRLARQPRECGGFEVHRRQIPIRRPELGNWIVQFDQSKRFRRPAAGGIVYVRLLIELKLVPPR